MKKLVSLLLALALLAGLAACGGGTVSETPTTPGTSSTPVTPSTSTPAEPTEPTKITIGWPAKATVTDWEDNDLTKMLEKTTGYDIEIIPYSSTKSEQVTQLVAQVSAKETLPDMLFSFSFSAAEKEQFAREGIFVDLRQFYDNEEYMSQFEWYQLVQEVVGQDAIDRAWTEGRSTTGEWWGGITAINESNIDVPKDHLFINQTWLDKLGLEIPRTYDELVNVLSAFKTQDPNGNGKADEIPMVGHIAIAKGDIPSWLINQYIYLNDTYPYNMGEDGKIYSPYTTDEYRQGLKDVHELYDQGLISELTWTIKERSELINLVNPADGVCTVGVWAGHVMLTISANSPSLYEYVTLPPLEGAYAATGIPTLGFNAYITTDCKDPDAAFRTLMALGTAESMRQQRYGTEGVDWKWVTDFKSQKQGMQIVNSDAFGGVTSTTWGLCPNVILYTSQPDAPVFLANPSDPNSGNLSWSEEHNLLIADYLETFMAAAEKTDPDVIVRKLTYTDEEQAAINDINATMGGYVKSARAEFISGVRDIDDDKVWAAYLKDLETMGLPALVQYAQTAWDRANG